MLLSVLALALGAAALQAPAAPAGPAPATPGDPDTLRVVAFGGSFTAQRRDARTSWPARLEALLSARFPELRIEVENVGRSGDTSGTALRRLRRDVLDRDPDVVVVQLGVHDAEVDIPRDEDFPAVAPGAFRSNLVDIVTTVRASGADVVLCQPGAATWTDELRGAFGAAPYLADDAWGFDRLLIGYAEVVRQVAEAQRAPLVAVHDADRDRGPEQTSSWRTDGRHPTDEANAWQARAVYEAIVPRVESGTVRARPLSAHRGPSRGWTLPELDLAGQTDRLVVVDREEGQYLGHPSTVLMPDGRTILCVYPSGHGRGAIRMKRSTDGGVTWSERLPVPASWAGSKETPIIERIPTRDGSRENLILWSGLHPARRSLSLDGGSTWSELEPVAAEEPWGGIVVMGDHLRMEDGRVCAWFHDDGRFFRANGRRGGFAVYQTESVDGGVGWSAPREIARWTHGHLCEPGVVRRGGTVALLLRENSRRRNSQLITSSDDGRSWSPPRPLAGALTGDRHQVLELPDGRLFISFRDTGLDSPRWGDWVAWVGTFEDVVEGRQGQLRLRLMDNLVRADCAYPALELLDDGTIVATTYGHWTEGEPPWIASVRIHVSELVP
ncbi:MAG: GDSL-type esterase/lipase family protein [Planctomycetota bacterium]